MATKYILLDGEVKVSDGRGGWRDPISNLELAEMRMELPADMEERVKQAILDEAEDDVRLAKAEAAAKSLPDAPSIRAEIPNLPKGSTPSNPLQEMGVDFDERLRLKWVASNPEEARKFLVRLGYEARQYGDGFNFAVRKPGGPWKLVDPQTGIASKDSLLDIIDLVVDAGQGYLTSLGQMAGTAVGGLAGQPTVGAAVGGGVAGAVTELARQGAGYALGVNEEFDAEQAAQVGAISGAIPVAGAAGRFAAPYAKKGMGWAAGKVGHAAMEAAARITGIPPETLLARAKIEGYGKLKSIVDTADAIRAQLAKFTDDLLPEKKAANRIINEADKQNVTVDMRPYFSRLREYTLVEGPEQQVTKKKIQVVTRDVDYQKAIKESGQVIREEGGEYYTPTSAGRMGSRGSSRGKDVSVVNEADTAGSKSSSTTTSTTTTTTETPMVPQTVRSARAGIRSGGNVNRVAKDLYEDQMQLLGLAKASPDAVPIKLAEAMKQDTQFLATKAQAYKDVKLSTPEREVLSKLAHGARTIVQRKANQTGITAPNGLNYGQNMAKVDRSLRTIRTAQDIFDPVGSKSDTSKRRVAISAVGRIWGESGVAHVDALRDLDALVGTRMADDALEASIGRAFSKGAYGAQGEVKWLPRLSATGNVLFYGSATAAGAATGGIGAVPILAAGSPMVNVAGIKAGLRAPQMMNQMASSAPVQFTGRAIHSKPAEALLQATTQFAAKRQKLPGEPTLDQDIYFRGGP